MKDIETNNSIVNTCSQSLIQDLRQIIEQARGRVAATANYELTMMYWHIGERINREVLDNQRAEYGKQIVSQVATQLEEQVPVPWFFRFLVTLCMSPSEKHVPVVWFIKSFK